MKRKRIRKILIIAFSVCFVTANVTSFTYAVDPVTFTEAETLGATIVDLYGAYNNTSLAYEQLSESGALTEIVTLYNNYASDASDPYTLAAIGAAAAAAGAIAVIYDAVTGQGYVQLYQEQYISSMDGYWDYQLTNAGLVRDSNTGLFNWSVNQNNIVEPVIIFNDYLWSEFPYINSTSADSSTFSNALPLFEAFYTNDSISFRGYTANNERVFHAFALPISNGEITVIVFSPANYASRYISYRSINDSYSNSLNSPNRDITVNGNRFWYGAISASGNIPTSVVYHVPQYSTINDGISAYLSDPTASNGDITIEPSIYIGDPLQNPLEISVPNVSDPNYAPQPARISTNIQWNPDWGTPVENPVPGVAYPITDPEILNDAVPGIWESIVSDGVEVGDPDPEPEDPGADPNEVTIPFLPITLPSFNFNLSGIWHYVVTWVASLGAWFTTLFTIWSCLPYAMVVPVYATAVIVIVLGVYRRFLT